MRHRRRLGALIAIALLASLVPVAGAGGQTPGERVLPDDVRDVGPDYNKGHRLPVDRRSARRAVAEHREQLERRGDLTSAQRRRGRNRVGATRSWLGLDDALGEVYFKTFRLKAKMRHVEIWVADDFDLTSRDLNFPYGDCRNGVRTKVTREDARYLAREFNNNMYPKESRVFSVPPDRNGRRSLATAFGLPRNYWSGGRGGGDNTVVLVDNVRDDNFYDTNNRNQFTYIAGFFFSVFNEAFDRNVMTIDGFDWLHRTRRNPPDDPAPGKPCTSAPARPFLYEGVFAHEYQHLLHYYTDFDETIWVNEGLSDWAQTVTGYVNPAKPITNKNFDSHVQCFQGYLGVQTKANPNPRPGGPENSLNLWGDQGDGEILCDYGAAYTMMEYLHAKYGTAFMTALHRRKANGLVSLQRLLNERAGGAPASAIVNRWAAMMALDRELDRGADLVGGAPGRYKARTLRASINWRTPHTHDSPGAPPNGSDYVRLRDAQGGFLSADQVTSVSFDGDEELAPKEVEWVVDGDPPGQPGDAAFYSGTGNNFDRAIARSVTVPDGQAALTFETNYNLEEGYDYGYVQVSNDGGETYRNELVVNGSSGGWQTETVDLSRYAGQDVIISFRYISDSSVNLDGWWVDDVSVGGTQVSDGSSLAGWQTPTQINPTDIENFSVQLVAYTEGGDRAWRAVVPLDDAFRGELSGEALSGAIGDSATVVAAIVTYNESTEEVDQYAPYELRVNGTTQPGGS